MANDRLVESNSTWGTKTFFTSIRTKLASNSNFSDVKTTPGRRRIFCRVRTPL